MLILPPCISVFLNHIIQLEVYNSLMLTKVQASIPTYEKTVESALQLYGYSKDQAFLLKDASIERIKAAQQGVLTSYTGTERYVNTMVKRLSHQILNKVENAVGVKGSSEDVMELETYRKRVRAIIQHILKGYIYHYSNEAYSKGYAFIKAGKEFSIPYFISLKATLIVSKELLMEFLSSRFNNMKLSYESSKDMVVMLVNGKFDEQFIKENIFGKFDDVKKMTVSVVQKGLEIKVDRKSLIENFDKFTGKFLESIKSVKEMSEGNIEEVKKKSRSMYEEVLRRIRQKEKEIKIQMKSVQTIKSE